MILLLLMADAVDEGERPFDDLRLAAVDFVAEEDVEVAFHRVDRLLTRLTNCIILRLLLRDLLNQ